MHMYALVTVSGTAISETALCEQHNEPPYTEQAYPVQQKDDADPWDGNKIRTDCTGNDALSCQVCGTFTVTTTKLHVIVDGWGVAITPIWAGEDDPERVSDIDVEVVRIAPDTVQVIGGQPCVKSAGSGENGLWYPVGNFAAEVDEAANDTQDLRARWFASEQEAIDHQNYTLRRWRHPNPWESFITL